MERQLKFQRGLALESFAQYHRFLPHHLCDCCQQSLIAVVTPFDSIEEPAIKFGEYLDHIEVQTPASRVSIETVCVALVVFVSRIKKAKVPTFSISPLNIHRLFLSTYVVVSKLYADETYPLSYIATIGGVSTKELIFLEFTLLQFLNFQTVITAEQYFSFDKLIYDWSITFHNSGIGLCQIKYECQRCKRKVKRKDGNRNENENEYENENENENENESVESNEEEEEEEEESEDEEDRKANENVSVNVNVNVKVTDKDEKEERNSMMKKRINCENETEPKNLTKFIKSS